MYTSAYVYAHACTHIYTHTYTHAYSFSPFQAKLSAQKIGQINKNDMKVYADIF